MRRVTGSAISRSSWTFDLLSVASFVILRCLSKAAPSPSSRPSCACAVLSLVISLCAFSSFVSLLYIDILSRQFFLHRGCRRARVLACCVIYPRHALV
ncbi:hypothetical protein IW261DRAFT_801494 [Armillaria novae-zelandiae]|uniref:Uncharacterized protein n=1 Tax=Armillaria novae-zelandiae TaxID=153914 RepID=A0AA39UKE7_9AGAR|nr:hypothetical protein IW261DRAFT_801494 [Armillaria novae-zelandiae]